MLSLWTRKNSTPPVEGALLIQSADALLAQHQVRLETIRQLAGVPRAHWDMLYRDLFEAFAGFVQALPASEAHHHAGPGGMLIHSLDVVEQGLKLRRGHLLPPGAGAEALAAEHDLWTYATATAALLHDIGKPTTDLRVTLYDRSGHDLGLWEPSLGPMPTPAAWYRVEFLREREHRLHEQVSSLLARIVLPRAGLSWLASSRAVMAAWLATLRGDFEGAGPLGTIVHEADRRSVSTDLAGVPGRLLTARAKPLHERLLTGLRYLLDQGVLPLNRKGAAGWLTSQDLWLVSKRALDALRDHLTQEGQGGIPSRNERLMDELQQHGVVVPNDDRAIWTVEVTVEDWSQSLTVLRFPAGRIWPDPTTRPEPFAGTVTPIERDREGGNETVPLAPTNPAVEPARLAATRAGSDPLPSFPDTTEQSPTTPETATAGENATTPVANEPPATMASSNPAPLDTDPEDEGTRFFEWLHEGLATGRLAVNQVNARVHIAAEGLLLISPGIFKDFDGATWKLVQKQFQKLNLHRKTPRGTNIFTYTVQGPRRQSRIRVYIVPEPWRVFSGVSLPPPNPLLSLPE